ncbi:MAG: SBBP repeat-containing protein [bacterium]
MSHFLNFSFTFSASVLFVLLQLSFFLFGCGGAVVLPIEKSETNSLEVPILLSVEPANNASRVQRNAKITLSFSKPLDSLTLSVNTEDTECSGTIQISTNDFKRCIRMNPLELKGDLKKIVLSPSGIYAAQKFHQIRLSTKIKSIKGVSLKKEITSKPGFRTSWSQQIGTTGDDICFATTVDFEGNIYLAGLTSADESGDEKDLFLAKYSPNGFQHWIQQAGFGRSVTAAVLQINEATQLRLSAYSQEEGSSVVIIAAYSMDGKKIFSKIIELPGIAPGNGLAMDKDGHIFIPAAIPFNILKIRKNGEKSWGTELSLGLNIRAIAADTENGLYISGNMKLSLDGKKSKGGTDIFLLKISQQGPKLWSRSFGTVLDESATALATKAAEAVAVVGNLPQSAGADDDEAEKHDAFVVNYNSAGKQQWTYILKGTNSEQSTVAAWTPAGDLLVGGFTDSSLEGQFHSGKEDVFLAKFDSAGVLLWLRQFGTPGNERPLALAIGRAGQIYVTGYTEGQMDGAKYSGGKDIFLVQFNKDGEKQ